MQPKLTELRYESHFAALPGGDRLHLRRIFADPGGKPVFLLHGFIENGRIFYTENGKGYAPFLARQGYDVFVADCRGQGQSTPRIGAQSDFGQQEFMTEEMPAFLELIKSLKGDQPVHWGAHSWGGVMLLSFLARYTPPQPVASMVFFGTKRRISVRNWPWFVSIFIFWDRVFPLIIRRKGYLDVVKYRFGADNESKGDYEETQVWVKRKDWIHWRDGFDFRAALKEMQLPPILYFAGKKDRVLGNPKDVRILAEETGEQDYKVQLLSKANGNAVDYSHINMLTHKSGPEDHFPDAVAWMERAEALRSNSPSEKTLIP